MRKVFSESIDVVIHVDRDDTVGDGSGVRRQVVEIAAVVPALARRLHVRAAVHARRTSAHRCSGPASLPARLERRMARVLSHAELHAVVDAGSERVSALAALAAGVFAYAAAGLVLGSSRATRASTSAAGDGRAVPGVVAPSRRRRHAGPVLDGLDRGRVRRLRRGVARDGRAARRARAGHRRGRRATRAYYARRRAARLREVQAAWPDALRDVAASLAAGRSLGAALGELARTGPPPLRPAFDRYTSTAAHGGHGARPRAGQGVARRPDERPCGRGAAAGGGARWPDREGRARRPRRRDHQGPEGARRDRDRGSGDEDQRPSRARAAVAGPRCAHRPRRRVPRLLPVVGGLRRGRGRCCAERGRLRLDQPTGPFARGTARVRRARVR